MAEGVSMRLGHSPMGFMFIFGPADVSEVSVVVLSDEPRMFRTRREAVATARRHGLKIDKRGIVSPMEES